MFRPAPTQEEAAKLGLTVEEASITVDLWPDNVDSVNTFTCLLTQWRTGPGGAIGLDYGAIQPVLNLNGVESSKWRDIFTDIRVMEDEALKVIRKAKNG